MNIVGTWPGYTINLAVPVSVANGGNGTATPSLTAGTGISITGSWPGYTIANTGALTVGTTTISGVCTNGYLLYNDSSTLGCIAPSGAGTVTSVALSLPSFITVSGSPVTTTGTLTGALANQTAYSAFGNFTGVSAAPTFSATPTLQGLNLLPAAGTTNQGINIQQTSPTAASVIGADTFFNYIQVTNNADVGGTFRGVGLYEQYFTGGTNQTGIAVGAFFNLNHNAASASGHDHIALVGQAYSSVVDTSGGEIYGGNIVCILASGANALGCNGLEVDTEVDSGATATRRTGIRSVNQGATHASTLDTAFSILSTNSGGSFPNGFTLSTQFGAFPLSTTSYFLTTDATITSCSGSPCLMGGVIDLHTLTFGGPMIYLPNYSISNAGVVSSKGDITGASPCTGCVGEILSNSASAVSVVSGTPKTITSVALTAGHWMCTVSGQTNPAGSSTTSDTVFSFSGTTNANGGIPGQVQVNAPIAAGQNTQANAGPVFLNLTTGATYYMVADIFFAVSTMTVSGYVQCERFW
jgi:hypothetical protein